MRLGGAKFTWDPDDYIPPEPGKFQSSVLTYANSVAYFSWGVTLIGKKVLLEWEWMSEAQYQLLKNLYENDVQMIWDLEEGTYSNFDVEITDLEGKFFEVVGPDLAYRRDVRLELLLLGTTALTQTTTTV